MEEEIQLTKTQRFKAFIGECHRVLRITKKPTMAEFKTIVKVTAIGMGLIGLVGFLITMAKQLIFG